MSGSVESGMGDGSGTGAAAPVRGVAADYEGLADSVRGVRTLLVEQRHGEARRAADGLLGLALELERRAVARNAGCDVKEGASAADEGTEQDGECATEAACLIAAQEQARQELRVTLLVLNDLRAHNEQVLASLAGQVAVGYDRMGKMLR